ncbi:MAG TPA: hypothetical protein VMA35_10515 [Candidatus Sulfopaludibacter sp.]|nr:hypothetical protein [Candidatus Sulfopaludibacter sp.]
MNQNSVRALAYEVIYQKPVRDLFVGLYRQIEQEVAERAKILTFRKDLNPGRRAAYRREVLTGLASRKSEQSINKLTTMNHQHPEQSRLLTFALTCRGLGYAVLEGEKSLVISGHSSVRNGDKNKQCLTKVEKLVAFYRPDVLVLQDVRAKGSRRALRIKRLQQKVIGLASKQKLKVELISEAQLRTLLLDDPRGTKHEMAEMIAKLFPDELALLLPPKRRACDGADSRMRDKSFT